MNKYNNISSLLLEYAESGDYEKKYFICVLSNKYLFI
jgi:hypothetical protein